MNHKFDKFNFTEIKNFCSLNMIVKKLKDKPKNGELYIYEMYLFINIYIYIYIIMNALVSRTYK